MNNRELERYEVIALALSEPLGQMMLAYLCQYDVCYARASLILETINQEGEINVQDLAAKVGIVSESLRQITRALEKGGAPFSVKKKGKYKVFTRKEKDNG